MCGKLFAASVLLMDNFVTERVTEVEGCRRCLAKWTPERGKRRGWVGGGVAGGMLGLWLLQH